MNISADLAAKVLDADLRNEIKKVSDGGTLSPSVRALLQARVLPDGSAKSRRVANLIMKYAAGARLTAGELAEVRDVHPEFAPDAEPDTTSAPPAPEPAGPALHLTPEPSPALGDGEVSRTQLDRWGQIYGVEHRQLRRWIARGKERHDPCPLDDPALLPAWIDKHLDKVRGALRDKVNAAADAARASAPPPSPPPAQTPAPAAPVTHVGAPLVAPLDLASVGGVEGESVEFFRRIFAAVKQQLEAAYADGSEDRIRTLHSRLEKAGESLRKQEIAAEARAKRLGDYLGKAEVFNEVMQALNTLSLMREHRAARVRAELADVPGEIVARVDGVLENVGRSEEAVLRNLAVLKSPADVSLALAA